MDELTAAELKVCQRLGITPEQYLAQKHTTPQPDIMQLGEEQAAMFSKMAASGAIDIATRKKLANLASIALSGKIGPGGEL
jgi:hypothetical protein